MVKYFTHTNKILKYFSYDSFVEFSKEIGKAVIISSFDKYNRIFSVFANTFIDETETECTMYIKYTMTYYSAFDLKNYKEINDGLLDSILYKVYGIGKTICYDCSHPIFIRMY